MASPLRELIDSHTATDIDNVWEPEDFQPETTQDELEALRYILTEESEDFMEVGNI